jgi:ArsR family transcriptional regulator
MNPVVFYKALADETRLKSLLLISHYQELCVCELMAALNLSQPKVSRHLAQLKQAGIVSDRRQGQWVYYQLDDKLVTWARTAIKQTLVSNGDYLRDDITRLESMGERPVRIKTCC